MFHSSRVLLILATLIAAAMVVRSETLAIAVLPTGKATPDVEALADLSTAKLSATPGYRALERRQLSEALQERRITATLAGAAQIQDRRQLGTLLHAEALLFLERVESDGAAAYRATLSFTDTGLRAGARWFSAEDADLEAIADDLVAIVGEQAARRRTIRRVVAVSPLVCDNLAFCHSHLGRSFQTVIEQAVPRDVLVVELDEARAFAKEQLLAPPEQPVFQHAMPILIGGSYRNVEDNVAFSLRFSQGEQAFPARKLLASQSEMAARLHEDVAGFLRSLDGSADSVPDYGPHAEAGALWRQAETLVKAGQWADAANLLETALLIAPPDATCDAATWGTTPREGDEGAPARLNCRALLRSRVIQTYAVMIYVGQRKENLREPHDAVRLLDWTDRSLDHLEAFVADGLPGGGPIANDPRFHLSPAMSQLFFLRDQLASRFGDDLKSRIASLEVRMRKCYLRCVEKQVREHGWIHLNPSPHVFFPPGSFAKVSEGDEASQEYLRDCIEYVRIAYAQDDGNRIIRDMLDSFEVGVSPKLMAPYMEQLRSVLTGEMGGLLYRYGELNLRLAHLRASTVFTSPEWASMSRTMRIEAQIEDAKRRILGMQEIAKEAAELQRLARRRWPDDQRLRDDLRSLVSECQTSIQHTQRHRGELQAVLDSNGVPRAVSSPKADIPDAAETLL